MKRMACVMALAAGTGLGLSAVTAPALADPGHATKASGLQLSIKSSSAASDDAVVLSVNYRGGQIDDIALYIDGAPVKIRSLTTRSSHGTIRFELEPTLLSEGEHEVVIKATDPDGNTATATTQLRITSSLITGPARLLFPRKNAVVQGVVPIEIQLDSAIRKPFVSFFVDNDFLELTNFAPFTYNWDSTRATNGTHTISVDVMDGETQAKIRSFSIPINVNNPGGLTNRQTVTPDLGHTAHSAAGQASKAISAAVATVLPATSLLAPSLKNRLPELAYNPLADLCTRLDLNGTSLREPASDRSFALATPNHTVTPTGFRTVPAVRPGALALFSMPGALLQFRNEVLSKRQPTGLLARPHRAGNFAALPDLDSPVRSFSLTPVASAPHAGNNHAGNNHGIQIAFDNQLIAFDVAPRVEHGMPLAPFRQIFEHTGGVVEWYGHSHTVRAMNSSRQIQFQIGHSVATVNNQPVRMQAQPYIDHGRAIVPLSFVRDAMNVSVHYDPATGHLRIDSRK